MICLDLNLSAFVSLINTAAGRCDDESCSAQSKSKVMAAGQEPKRMGESSAWLDTKAPEKDWTGVDEGDNGQLNRDIKEKITVDGNILGGIPYSSIP